MSNHKPQIGIFGGTFNPIHFGHLRLAEEVRQRLSLKKILFIPSSIPPLKKEDVAGADDRLQMVKMAIKGNPCFELSEIELRRKGPSYTVYTLREIEETPGLGKGSVFIMGIDSFLELTLWYRPEEVIRLTDIAVVNRPTHDISEIYSSPYIVKGSEKTEKGIKRFELTSGRTLYVLPVMGLNISASEIRNLIKKGGSIKYLLPESVESYIISKGLYRD